MKKILQIVHFEQPFGKLFGKPFGEPFGLSYEEIAQQAEAKPKNIWLSFAELLCLITLGISMLAFFPS